MKLNICFWKAIRLRKLKTNRTMCAKILHCHLLPWNFKQSEYEHGCTSLGDDEHSEHPNILTADDNIDQIRQIALNDWQIKIKETEKRVY